MKSTYNYRSIGPRVSTVSFLPWDSHLNQFTAKLSHSTVIRKPIPTAVLAYTQTGNATHPWNLSHGLYVFEVYVTITIRVFGTSSTWGNTQTSCHSIKTHTSISTWQSNSYLQLVLQSSLSNMFSRVTATTFALFAYPILAAATGYPVTTTVTVTAVSFIFSTHPLFYWLSSAWAHLHTDAR